MTLWQRTKDKKAIEARRVHLKKGQPFDGVFDHSVNLYYEKLKMHKSQGEN